MPMRSKYPLLNGCRRRSHPLQWASARVGPRRTIRKSHMLVLETSTAEHSVQVDTSALTPTPTDEIPVTSLAKVEESIDFELIEVLTSNSSVTTHNKQQSQKDDTTGSEAMASMVGDNEERQVILIEGNKAIMVNANRWPTRPYVSVSDAYKFPNPKLTPAELKSQMNLVEERKQLDSATRRERLRVRYIKSIYCLPKKLIMESRTRLASWYQLPNEKDIVDSQAEREPQEMPAKNKSSEPKGDAPSSNRASTSVMQARISTAAPTRTSTTTPAGESTVVAETSAPGALTAAPDAATAKTSVAVNAEADGEDKAKPKGEPKDDKPQL